MSESPSGWVEKNLGELCSITTGKKDVNEGSPTGQFPFFTCSRKHTWSNSYSFDTEAILIAGNGDVGWLNYYNGKFEAYQRTYVLSGFKASTSYLRHYIEGGLRKSLEQKHAGSVIQFIKFADLDYFRIKLPNSNYEQLLIARILDTLDTQIQKTEALIAKLEKVKEGLLHDLLTRGIDEHGQLRPSPEQAPELYKDSPLGLIPRGWETQELRALGKFSNGLNKPKEAFGSGTRFINISDVYPDYLDAETLGRVQVTSGELAIYAAEPGDIFLDRSSVKLEGVGYPTVFEGADEQVVFSGFIIRFRLNEKSRILPRFLCCQMRSYTFRTEVFKVATKSANVNINQAALSALVAGVPSTDEQCEIVLKEGVLDARLQAERKTAARLCRIKAGLMDDLLTGRVRVTPLLEKAQATTPA